MDEREVRIQMPEVLLQDQQPANIPMARNFLKQQEDILMIMRSVLPVLFMVVLATTPSQSSAFDFADSTELNGAHGVSSEEAECNNMFDKPIAVGDLEPSSNLNNNGSRGLDEVRRYQAEIERRGYDRLTAQEFVTGVKSEDDNCK